jgi:TolB-like protein/DNA-binding winged helix-turn-helix (wHTH) protein/Flp pilus assembly protein TadD
MAQHALALPQQYRFGVFTLDLRSGELHKHGVRMKLQERPRQALLALLERPGEVVTRQELRDRLWPSDTYVDFEHGISSAMNKARAALSDSAQTPRYIETVGRLGYRFIYPVTPVFAPVQAPQIIENATPRTWRMSRWAVVAIVLFAIGCGLAYWYGKNAEHSSVRSIAVLPLKNLSADAEQEFFSEGLTDELITRLATLRGLRVISRTSIMQYKNTNKPLPQIAKELNVDAVVEGTVQRYGTRIRINAQLVHAIDDHHIWAQSYDREQRDILNLQNEVTNAIAESIKLSIAPDTKERLANARPVDPQAHEDYLRAKYHWSMRRVPDFWSSISFYESAIARDPTYALAYAGLANSYAMLGGYSLSSQSQFIPKARAAANKALELDPNLSDAHLALAVMAQNYDWDWAAAEKEYLRAIQLDPNNATAHHWYAEFLSLQGKFGHAVAEIDRAEELDPLSLIIRCDKGAIYLYARRYKDAIAAFQSVLQRDPSFPRAHLIQHAYMESGNFDAALADAEKADAGGETWSRASLGYALARKGERKRAREILGRLMAADRPDVDPAGVLYIQIALGDRNAAFASLERAVQRHSMILPSLRVNPVFDPLRDDPRFQSTLKRLGL